MSVSERFQGIWYSIEEGYFRINNTETEAPQIELTPTGTQFLREFLNKNVKKEPILSDKDLLKEAAKWLDRWTDEMAEGGWSTHHIKPMRTLESKIYEHLGRSD